jgi:hypothetical protein
LGALQKLIFAAISENRLAFAPLPATSAPSKERITNVADPLFILAIIACLAVVVILMFGLGGFATGGAFNKKNSNKLMRYRIGAQFVAVCIILLYVFLRNNGG